MSRQLSSTLHPCSLAGSKDHGLTFVTTTASGGASRTALFACRTAFCWLSSSINILLELGFSCVAFINRYWNSFMTHRFRSWRWLSGMTAQSPFRKRRGWSLTLAAGVAASLVFISGSLSGCATLPQSAAKVEDQAVVAAEWTLCNAISVGAWRRAYAGDPVRTEAWLQLCDQPVVAPTIPTGFK